MMLQISLYSTASKLDIYWFINIQVKKIKKDQLLGFVESDWTIIMNYYQINFLFFLNDLLKKNPVSQ